MSVKVPPVDVIYFNCLPSTFQFFSPRSIENENLLVIPASYMHDTSEGNNFNFLIIASYLRLAVQITLLINSIFVFISVRSSLGNCFNRFFLRLHSFHQFSPKLQDLLQKTLMKKSE